MQEMMAGVWLTVALGTIALLAIAIGLVVAVASSKQKELQIKKRQYEELQLSEKKYKNLFENSPAGMVRLTTNSWEVVDINHALIQILYVNSANEIKEVFNSIASRDKEIINKKLQNNGSIKDHETLIRRKDGTDQWISFSASMVSQENYIEAVIIDITARIQAEEQIREQAKLLDQAHDAILVLDLNKNIRYWNKGAERLYGYQSLEVIGKQVTKHIYEQDKIEGFDRAFELTLQNSEWSGELYQKNQNGKAIVADCRWTLVRNTYDEPTSILQVCTDVTERKRLEARFFKAQRIESIGIFASGIAHDLNNALSPILVGANVLKRKVHDQQSRRLLNAIESSAKDGSEMVKQVLSFVKGVEGKHVILNPRKIVKDIINQLDQILPESVCIQTKVGEKISSIMGDSTQLQQVLMNLCLNARDAMPNGGELIFTVENTWIEKSNADEFIGAVEGEYVVFSIKDTGVGIAPSEVHKIFDPFYTTKELGKGTGLGLSISHGIVKGHKGFIAVESLEGKGSTFKMFIPAVPQKEKIEETEKNLQDSHQRIIFIPASEDVYSEILYDGLEGKGFEPRLVSGKAQVMKQVNKFKDENITVIFDGFSIGETPELINEIIALGLQVRFIMLVDKDQIDEINRSEIPLGNVILEQPITFELLYETIRQTESQ